MKFNAVAIYVRVSTDIQADGYSIDEQLSRLRKFCEAQDWNIYREYIDPGYSGSNIDRPGMLAMLKDVREKRVDIVLVYKLDRLSRSQRDTLYLIEEEFLPRGVDFVSMSENFDTSTPLGRAMIGILSVFAQLEREQIKERMAMGRLGRAKAGLWRAGSNPPIGYDLIDGKLVVNEYEALQVKKIYQLFLDGMSIRGITNYMNERYTNKYSSYKDSHQTGTILKNRLYIGKIKYKGQEFDGIHEPIIDVDTFDRVQKRYQELSKGKEHYYVSPYKSSHLLSGITWCQACGARYFAVSSPKLKLNKETGKKEVVGRHHYYKCYTRDGNPEMKTADHCRNPIYRVDYLDGVILDEIKKLKADPEYLDRLIIPQTLPEDDETQILKKEIERIDDKINRLMDLYTVGGIDIAVIRPRLEALQKEKDQLEERIDDEQQESGTLTKKQTCDILNNSNDIDSLEHEEQRQLVQSLIKRIVVGSEKGELEIHWRFN